MDLDESERDIGPSFVGTKFCREWYTQLNLNLNKYLFVFSNLNLKQ
jgi:hypothetical protein